MPITHYTPGESFPALDSLPYPQYTVTQLSTAANLTFTAAQILGGVINRDCNGADRSDVCPAAADLVAAIPGAAVGTSCQILLRNIGAGNTTTLQTNTGVTLSGTMAVPQGNTGRFQLNVTSITPGSEAYTVYSMGALLH